MGRVIWGLGVLVSPGSDQIQVLHSLSHFKLFLVSGSGSRLFRMLGHLRVWVDLVCGVVYSVVELETRVALGHQVDKIILE